MSFARGHRRALLLCVGVLITAVALLPSLASSKLSSSPKQAYGEMVRRDGARVLIARGPGARVGLRVGRDYVRGTTRSKAGTVEFWARPRRVVRHGPAGRIALTWGSTGLTFKARLRRPQWTHVAVSWDQQSITLWLDGVLVERDSFGAPSGGGVPHVVGLEDGSPADPLRFVALYPDAIEVDSAAAHHESGLALFGPRPVTEPSSSRVVAHASAVPGNTVLPAITGTAKDGQTLTSSTGTWTGSPTSYARAWQRCDAAGANCVAISGATGTTYLVASADVGKTIRVKVTATNASGSGNATSSATAAVTAAAPVNTALPAITGTAKDGQTLTSTTGTWTGTATITYARQWRRCDGAGANCVDIAGATATTYVLVAADVGKTVRVVLTASNAAGSASATSAQTAAVTAAAPVNTAVPAITGTVKEGQLLSASTGTWTGTATITYTYQWQSCNSSGASCVAISGATSATYRLASTDVGKTVKVVVTATNSAGNASATSAASAVVTTGPPVSTVAPTVSGTAKDGQVLTTANGSWAGTATITYTRQWKRCDSAGANCTTISGATALTYTLTSADVGSTVKVTWTATNGVGSASADSSVTATVAALAPANTVLPTITGTAKDGQTLTSTNGTWTGSTPLAYTRQWKRCNTAGGSCSSISGATAATYVLTAADVGATIRTTVTATNAGSAVSADTAATAVVAALAPANTALPTITGTARDGQTLTSSTGTWTGSTPLTYTRQWKRCNTAGGSCTNISGATAAIYALAAADVGSTIRVTTSASNGAGSASADSAATATVAVAPPSNVAVPTITGTAEIGSQLHATTGTWNGTAPITYAYQWSRCSPGGSCVPVAGATSVTYTVTSADVGSQLKVAVTASNSAANVSADSTTTSAVLPDGPINVTLPAVSGTPQDGQTVTTTNGTWSGTGTITFVYRWQSCLTATGDCADIPDATGSTYVVAGGDVGQYLRAKVTAIDTRGNTVIYSAETSAVSGRAPSNTQVPTITGPAHVGHELEAQHGAWQGTQPLTYAYDWRRCDAAGANCASIASADEREYVPSGADVGHTIRVNVTATNAQGTSAVQSAATAPVAAASSTDPVVTLTGALIDNAATWVTPGSYAVTIHAIASSGALGLARVELTLDGETLKRWDDACSGAACSATLSYTLDASELAEGRHVVEVEVADDDGRLTTTDTDLNIDTGAPPSPHNLTVADSAGIDLEWSGSSATDVDGYTILRRSGTGPWAAIATTDLEHYTDALAPVGAPLQYAVEAGDQAGNLSAPSTAVTAAPGWPAVPVPSGASIEARSDGISLEWQAALGVAGYEVYRRESGATDFERISDELLTAPAYLDDLAESETSYVYEIRSVSVDGRLSAPSSSLVSELRDADGATDGPDIVVSGDLVDELTQPAIGQRTVTVTASEGTTAAPGAGVTALHVAIDGTSYGDWSATCPAGNCSISHAISVATATLPDGPHQLTVTAVDARSRQAEEDIEFTTNNFTPAAITGLRVARDATADQLTAQWAPSTDGDLAGYEVQFAGGPWQTLPSTQTTYGPAACAICPVAVRAIDTAGGRGTATEDDDTLHRLAAPVATAAGQTGVVNLSWSAVSGADGYLVYRQDPVEGSFSLLTAQPVTGLAYTDSDVELATSYEYFVRAVAGTRDMSPESNHVTAAAVNGTTRPTLTLSGSLFDQQGQIVTGASMGLTATAVESSGPGVTSVQLVLDDDPQDFSEQTCAGGGCSLSHTFTLDTGDLAEGQHHIDVVATDASHATTTVGFDFGVDLAAPRAPHDLKAVSGTSGIALTWSGDDPDIAGYDIYRGTTASTLTLLHHNSSADAAYTDTTATAGTRYWYAVEAIDASARRSERSAAIDALAGGAASATPQSVTANGVPYAIDLAWQPVVAGDLKGYRIYRELEGQDRFLPLNTSPVTAAHYTDDDLAVGVQGSYIVHTVDEHDQEGPASAIVAGSAAGVGPTQPAQQMMLSFLKFDASGYRSDNYYKMIDGTLRDNTAEVLPCTPPTGQSVPVMCPMSGDGVSWLADRPEMAGTWNNSTSIGDSGVFVRDRQTGENRAICSHAGGQLPGDIPFCDVQNAPFQSYSPNGDHLYFVSTTDHAMGPQAVFRADLPSGDTSVVVPPPSDPLSQWLSVRVMPSGKMFLSSIQNAWPQATCSFWLANGDGTNLQSVTPPIENSGTDQCGVLTPTPSMDGFLYADWSDGYPRPAYVSADGTTRRLLAPRGVGADLLSISPQGDRVGFAGVSYPINADGVFDPSNGWPSGNPTIYSVGLDAGDVRTREIGPDGDFAYYPTFVNYAQASKALTVDTALTLTSDADGNGQLNVDVDADGTNVTPERAWLLIGDQRVNARVDATGHAQLHLSLAGVPEGRKRARIVVTAGGLERSVVKMVSVDHTAPLPPAATYPLTGLAAGQAGISWSDPDDPDLADGSPGSGIDYVDYRLATPSGGWSAWTRATDNQLVAPSGDLSGDAELRIADRAGNIVRHQMGVPLPDESWCDVKLQRVDSYRTGADFEHFVPKNRHTKGVSNIHCHGDLSPIGSAIGDYCLEGQASNGKFLRVFDVPGKPKSGCAKLRSVKGRDSRPAATTGACHPSFDGETNYRVAGIVRGRMASGRAATPFRFAGKPNEYKRGFCPITRDRENNEVEGWKYLTKTDPLKMRHYSSTPGYILGHVVLGYDNRPTDDSGAWEAHHIIPVGESQARTAQAIGFRCGLHPNAITNGVWLRGFKGRRAGKLWDDWGPEAQMVSYHPDAKQAAYFSYMVTAALDSTAGGGECRPGALIATIGRIKVLLIHGDVFGPEKEIYGTLDHG